MISLIPRPDLGMRLVNDGRGHHLRMHSSCPALSPVSIPPRVILSVWYKTRLGLAGRSEAPPSPSNATGPGPVGEEL